MHESPSAGRSTAATDHADVRGTIHQPVRRGAARRRLVALARRLGGERGAATAEYAVATMAAVGFAGLLVVILRGDEVRGILTDLVRNALTVG
ncbi:DUF4244 domain-containing protein [Agromyces sp. GXS1127]|uniref:DUF4244 domain-containing protein n=1 Tax=Agromyces sp. GXS1127 TaxID=3424181 RepID=UPI003D315213